MTYRELLARGYRTAHHLRAAGVRAGDTVAVLLDPGPDLPATLLGVWFAGAAYLPLDPGYPAERVGYVLADAGATAAVTHGRYADRFGTCGVPLVDLDADAGALAARPAQPTGLVPDGADLAYVIYTSGSTGRPKGVMVPHEGVANHIAWAVADLAGRGAGGSALFSSVAFDLVVPILWAPLACGQTLHVPPAGSDLSHARPPRGVYPPAHRGVGDRLSAIAAARLANALARLTIGDRVRIGHDVRPGYVHGLPATVIRRGTDTITIQLDRPIGKFVDGCMRCSPLAVEKIAPE